MNTVLVELRDGVRTVTLNRPEKRNALDATTLAQLGEAFSAAPAADERVAVIRGAGPVFCSGVDLRERTEQRQTPGAWTSVEPVFQAVERYPLPVVAVVHGDAIAGGAELALHCDLVVAATTARFSVPLSQLGIALSWDLARKLVEAAGPVIAREILLLGDLVTAERLAQLGVIARAAPPERLEAEAEAVVERLVANAPLSLRAHKAMLLRAMAFRSGIDHAEADALAQAARASQDAQEGMRARLEKRSPRFQGR